MILLRLFIISSLKRVLGFEANQREKIKNQI